MIDRENGDHSEDEIDGADDNGLEQRCVGGEAHAAENIRGVVHDHVDAHELLEDRQSNADEDEEHAVGKQLAGVMFADRGADLGNLFLGFLGGRQLGQHRARLRFISLEHEKTWGFRHEKKEDEKKCCGYGAGEKHVAPADRVEPHIAAAGLGDAKIDEKYDQHAENNGELVPCNQVAPYFRRCNFRNVHGREHGGEPNADAAENAVADKVPHVARPAMADWGEWEFWRGGAQGRDEEEHRGDDEATLAADACADPPAKEAADNTTDKRAGDDETQQGTGGIGLRGIGQIAESRIDEVGLQAVDG